MAVNYTPDDPIPGTSRSSGVTEVQRWIDYADTIGDVDDRIVTLEAAPGGGGSIAVEDDGVEVLAAATRFNFTGAGVTVTDDGAGQVGVAIPAAVGGIIAAHSYQGGSDAVLGSTATTSTFVDIDATNAAVSFTVPPSGVVVVDVGSYGGANTAAEFYRLNLRSGSSDVAGTGMRVHLTASTTNPNYGRYLYRAVVSGLTPGASLTYKVGHAVMTGGGSNGRTWTGPTFGPLTIVVFAVP